jgi:hypothetical protein
MLIHIGMRLVMINWILNCLSIASFYVLINESTSKLFCPSKRHEARLPLSLLLLLIVAKSLSRAMIYCNRRGTIKGIKIGITFHLTHLLFIDDVFLFSNGSSKKVARFKDILELFYKAMAMELHNKISHIYIQWNSKRTNEVPQDHITFQYSIEVLGFPSKTHLV